MWSRVSHVSTFFLSLSAASQPENAIIWYVSLTTPTFKMLRRLCKVLSKLTEAFNTSAADLSLLYQTWCKKVN